MSDKKQADRTQDEPLVRDIKDIPLSEKTKHPVGEPPDDDDVDPEAVASLGLEAANISQWRVGKSLLTLREQINLKAPNRSKASDGTIGDPAHRSRASDHNPWVTEGNVGIVTAMDITHDPDDGCDAGALAESLRSSRDPRVKYLIWNRRIANPLPMNGQPAWAWRPYSGRNPHDKHVHISVKSDKPNYDSTGPWAI